MNNELPNLDNTNLSVAERLPGFQSIVDPLEPVKAGDYAVLSTRSIEGVSQITVGDFWGNGAAIYRKIPVAKAGDLDEDWKRLRDALGKPLSDECCEEMPDINNKIEEPDCYWKKAQEAALGKGSQQLLDELFEPVPGGCGAVTNKARTNDDGKPPLAMLPWGALEQVAMVQLYGAKKYGTFQNYRKGMEVSRNLSCAVRHIAAYMEGETLDPESGESHLAHAACRLLFVLQNEADGVAIDDRHRKTYPAEY